jgi:hypothetical protein
MNQEPIAEKDACTCSPYFGSCEYSPDCPRHGRTSPTPSVDPYDNHDRRILEDADAGRVDARIVVVRCPHRIGLAYQGAPAAGMEDDWLMRLPCPCNDRSEVVAVVEPNRVLPPGGGA